MAARARRDLDHSASVYAVYTSMSATKVKPRHSKSKWAALIPAQAAMDKSGQALGGIDTESLQVWTRWLPIICRHVIM